MLFFVTRRTIDRQQEILDEIKKCTAAVNTNAIDQTAYIQASADKKNLNLDMYREHVHRELNSPRPSQSSDKSKFHNLLEVTMFLCLTNFAQYIFVRLKGLFSPTAFAGWGKLMTTFLHPSINQSVCLFIRPPTPTAHWPQGSRYGYCVDAEGRFCFRIVLKLYFLKCTNWKRIRCICSYIYRLNIADDSSPLRPAELGPEYPNQLEDPDIWRKHFNEMNNLDSDELPDLPDID